MEVSARVWYRGTSMRFSLDVGLRYVRSKKRRTISVITVIAVAGVSLGVASLLAVLSITSGFQDEFRAKVLGVNAHVLVLKYGLDFEEYRDVIARAEQVPAVIGAAPFVINEMMLAKGDRLAGVLVKGVDPERMPTVLDLPEHVVEGSIEGLRREGARPALDPGDLERPTEDGDLDRYLRSLVNDGGLTAVDAVADAGPPLLAPDEDLDEALARLLREEQLDDTGSPRGGDVADPTAAELAVPSPDAAEQALNGLELDALPSDELEQALFGEEVAPDAAERTAAAPGVVVGRTLARNLGIRVGDAVRLISPLTRLDTSLWAPNAGSPRAREFRVTGIFEAGFQEYDTRLVYVDLYEAQSFFDHGDTVTGVEIRLSEIDAAPRVARELEAALGEGPYHTLDWQELNHNLFTALAVQKEVLGVVIATIIFVAAFNVIATLIMIVLEKRREIAILKAMGATDGSVLAIFFVQGAVIGVVGTVLGLLIGGGVCAYLATFEFPLDPKVYLIDHLPIRASLADFVRTGVTALAICLASTFIPSWWAARLRPADGVRYE